MKHLVKREGHLEKFKEKYKGHKLKRDGSRVYVELEREHVSVMDFMKRLLRHSYLKDKANGLKLLGE